MAVHTLLNNALRPWRHRHGETENRQAVANLALNPGHDNFIFHIWCRLFNLRSTRLCSQHESALPRRPQDRLASIFPDCRVAPDPLSGRAVDGGIIIDELEGHIRRSTRITLVSGDICEGSDVLLGVKKLQCRSQCSFRCRHNVLISRIKAPGH
jgi:hypothetical protein